MAGAAIAHRQAAARFTGPAGVLCAALALSACVVAPQVAPPPAVPVVTPSAPPPPPPVIAPPRSAQSAELVTYYQRLQDRLLVQGLLRGDGGGPDTPFTDTQLARNFIRIALFDEYIAQGDELRAQATVSRLRRWDGPIAMTVEFGPSVPQAQRDRDRASVGTYAARLSRLTGVPIRQTEAGANFTVLILNEDDRLAFEPRLRSMIPGLAPSSVRAFVSLPRDQLCLVIGTFKPDGVTYDKAVALIRGEHPDLLRTGCIHEELAQGMGLSNDSPQARPSIFNDDEEFSLLTTHDELLLRMLYDPRFVTGMSAAEAAPIARLIATDMVGGGS